MENPDKSITLIIFTQIGNLKMYMPRENIKFEIRYVIVAGEVYS